MKVRLMLIFSIVLSVLFINGCSISKSAKQIDPVSLNIETIRSIEVCNGTNGDSVLLSDDITYETVLKLIQENKYLHKREEDKNGWTIGIRIYSSDTLYWFMPEGVNDYEYENKGLFKELLEVILKEEEIQFAKNYYDFR